MLRLPLLTSLGCVFEPSLVSGGGIHSCTLVPAVSATSFRVGDMLSHFRRRQDAAALDLGSVQPLSARVLRCL